MSLLKPKGMCNHRKFLRACLLGSAIRRMLITIVGWRKLENGPKEVEQRHVAAMKSKDYIVFRVSCSSLS